MPTTLRLRCFDPRAIAESGQCFRMLPTVGGATVIASGRRLTIETLGGGRFRFSCDREGFDAFWRDYLDLNVDYAAMQREAPEGDAFLRRAIRCGHGLRILRQDPWETLIGFILSQRKSIPAIRGCMERLCERFGDDCGGYRAFPTASALAYADEATLRDCGLGYRAPYVLAAARAVAEDTLNLSALAALDDEALLQALAELRGVGVKVTSCVALFGYHRLACAPVDVWIARVIDEEYGGRSPFGAYGAFAGLYQQYLFCLKRRQA